VAGENVTGTLHLSVDSDIKCRAVRLKLSGEGFVHWATEHRGQHGGTISTDYYGG